MKALVIFQPDGFGWIPQISKVRFRHLYIALDVDGEWVVIDPRLYRLNVGIDGEPGFDLKTFCEGKGLTVIETETREVPDRWWGLTLFMLGTCVGMAKRFLGIRKWWIWTPDQLFRHLVRISSDG